MILVRRHHALALRVLGMIVLALLGIAVVRLLIDKLPWTVTWDVWIVLIALGTVGATLVALALALRVWMGEKDATARVVSAWVTGTCEPRSSGSSYKRTVTVHVANEGSEPVFDAKMNVLLGRHRTPIGPLSAPTPIGAVPPRRELVFDISTPLLAHSSSWNPLATLNFSDSRGRRWLRDADGGLRDVSRKGPRWSKAAELADERQLGETSLLNPMMIALAFLATLRDPDADPADLKLTLAPEARGWAQTDWGMIRAELGHYQPTSMVAYPAPRIARVKLSGDQALEGHTAEGEGLELKDCMFMTLTLHPERGWRLFSIGESVLPEAIDFDGTLGDELQPLSEGMGREK